MQLLIRSLLFLTILVVAANTFANAAQPASMQADEIWVIRGGNVVYKVPTDAAEAMTIYGPRGGTINVCPPGGCPPQQPPQPAPPVEPPKFDFPGDVPAEVPAEVAPRGGVNLAMILSAVAAAGGLAAGYMATRDPDVVEEDDDPVAPAETE